MEAQSINDPLLFSDSSFENDPIDLNEDGIIDTTEEDINIPTEEDNKQIKDKSNKDSTTSLTDYVFKKLQSFGYPGRRLEEFKKKFIKETISPDGVRDVTIEIPDKYYPDDDGFTKTVDSQELAEISMEMGDKFGLNFNGAERTDGKWNIKMTSAKKEKDKNEDNKEEISFVKDNLEDVYGSPSNSKGKKVNAFTCVEMLKGNYNNLVNKSSQIMGDKNAL